MYEGITTLVVFSLFYAIQFGATLNRLQDWSAFWRDNRAEPAVQWKARVTLSVLMLNVVPAAYFGFSLWVLQDAKVPSQVWPLVFWAIFIFLAVLFIPAVYRLWVCIVLWLRLHPQEPANLQRHFALGSRNFFYSALLLFVLSGLGLGGAYWLTRP